MRKTTCLLAAVAFVAAPAVAGAADELGRDPGIKVFGDAGVLTYAGEAAGLFDPGARYGVSVGLEPFQAIGLELGYQGAAYTVENEGGTVLENGAQALVKVGPKLGAVEPYALGGAAWTRFSATDDAEASGLSDDSFGKIPVGAGVDFTLPVGDNPLVLGARGMYNFVIENEAFDTPEPRNDDQIGASLVIGGEF